MPNGAELLLAPVANLFATQVQVDQRGIGFQCGGQTGSAVTADLVGALQRARNEKLVDALIEEYAPVIDIDNITSAPEAAGK